MKILIISGFLGAGKTTFIKALARQTGREFAILENEYGAAGVDGDNLKNSLEAGEVTIWELAQGCICCSMKGDFAASVLTIANSVDPEFLVIEPTGVGMLSNIICNLRQIEYERISLLAPITIVDGNSYDRYRREFPEVYRDQIAAARTVLVSKMEQAEEEERAELGRKLKEWNPKGEIVTDHYSFRDQSWWKGLLHAGFDGTKIEAAMEDGGELPDTFSLCDVSLDCPEALLLLMEQIIHGRYGDICRAKGQMKAGTWTFQFDIADGRYSVIDTEINENGKAVFIGRGIRRQELRRCFMKMKGDSGMRGRKYMRTRNPEIETRPVRLSV